MKINKGYKILVICIIGLTFCAFLLRYRESQAMREIIRIAGSSTMIPIITKAAERFMDIHPNVRITVSPGGSGVGVKSIANNLVDIGMVSRNISEEERKAFPQADFRTYSIGADAVACVVSSEIYDAGVHALSKQQMGKIYSGSIDNWKEVGGPDKKILCIDKESHRGARHVFMEYVFGDEEAQAQGTNLVVGSNNETQAKVALSDAGIAYVSFGWINQDVKGVGVKIGEEIIWPTTDNIRKHIYPIVRNLYLVTNGPPSGAAGDFIYFMTGPEGQSVVNESGFIAIQ